MLAATELNSPNSPKMDLVFGSGFGSLQGCMRFLFGAHKNQPHFREQCLRFEIPTAAPPGAFMITESCTAEISNPLLLGRGCLGCRAGVHIELMGGFLFFSGTMKQVYRLSALSSAAGHKHFRSSVNAQLSKLPQDPPPTSMLLQIFTIYFWKQCTWFKNLQPDLCNASCPP